ncbi:DMT family transporter [Solicola gregarius]|uniref:DMT family transporter n=1 Tax=Solicola gregarius TaxID=2908642 RepID=A0AA46THQ1_9ACTN|nr:DMT family transporter [Solicola gregarius]UYM05376.1 DMT family transporter [Solicola gregarius]
MRTTRWATLALLLVTATWGSTFILIKDLLDRVPTLDFLAVRFAIAAAAMFVVAPRAVARLSPQTRRRGLAVGLIYGLAQILQTEGLAYTDASISGFVTGMYVVLTPLIAALVLRNRIGKLTWCAVAMATVGLGFLSLSGLSVGFGEAITFGSAILYATHIVALSAWSTARDAYGLAVVQMAVIGAMCLAVTGWNGVVLPDNGRDWVSVVYMAVVAGAIAMLAQTWAQAHLPATRAAIIMTMEPVFAATFAIALGDETLTPRVAVGGTFVVVAMLAAELAPRRRIEAEVPHLGQ